MNYLIQKDMQLTNNHFEALESIGFDLAADKGVLTEYFTTIRTESHFFKTQADGKVVCAEDKTKAEITQKMMAWAIKKGVENASVEICEMLAKAATDRKNAILEAQKATVDADLAKAKAEVARLEALKAQVG